MCQLAVSGKFRDPKIDRAVFSLVRDILRLECLNHLNHPRDVLGRGGCGIVSRRFDTQRLQVLEEGRFEFRGEVGQRHAALFASRNGFVVDVGQVHDPLDFKATRLEVPLQQVLENIRPEVTYMGEVIHGRPAGIHLHHSPGWIQRFEGFDGAGGGVEQADRHGHRKISLVNPKKAG